VTRLKPSSLLSAIITAQVVVETTSGILDILQLPFLYARRKTGCIMFWRCPSVRASVRLGSFNFLDFLAHLSWKLKWAFLIALCPSSVRLSVCPSVRPSVCLSVRLLHFQLLLQNRWANFNQSWHKSSVGKGIQNCTNEGQPPTPRGDNNKKVKILQKKFKNLLQNQLANFNQSWYGSSLGKGNSELYKCRP
jgi:hypothetical protein